MVLSGCSSLSESAVGSTLLAFIPWHGDVSEHARDVPYASIDFSMGMRGGLLVMAEQKNGLTYWQTSQSEVIGLKQGFLQATWRTEPRLEMIERRDHEGQPVAMQDIGDEAEYTVVTQWTDGQDRHHAGRARARWHCRAQSQRVKLPLTRRKLHQCEEKLDWDDRGSTRSVYWRDDDGHVWKANVAAWPGAPSIKWEVARPWW